MTYLESMNRFHYLAISLTLFSFLAHRMTEPRSCVSSPTLEAAWEAPVGPAEAIDLEGEMMADDMEWMRSEVEELEIRTESNNAGELEYSVWNGEEWEPLEEFWDRYPEGK